MRLTVRSLLIAAGLALATVPASAGGRYSFGIGVSGDSYAFGIGYTSRGYGHYRPSYRPSYYCPPPRVYCPPPRYYAPPVYYVPPPRHYCPPPRYHRPRYYGHPGNSFSFGFGYSNISHSGSSYSVAGSADSYSHASYSAPQQQSYAYEPQQDYTYASSFNQGATGIDRRYTSYSEVTREDDRTISQAATYYKDRLIDSRTEVIDNRPRGGDLQAGTNYTHDGRLVYPPPVPQVASNRAVDTPQAEPASNQSTGERPTAVAARATSNTSGVQIVSASLNRTLDPAIADRIAAMSASADTTPAPASATGVTIRQAERVPVSNRAGSPSPNARPSGPARR